LLLTFLVCASILTTEATLLQTISLTVMIPFSIDLRRRFFLFALTVTPATTETMSVQFIFEPRSEVTVTVSRSDPSAAVGDNARPSDTIAIGVVVHDTDISNRDAFLNFQDRFGLKRCDRYVEGWLKLADPETGLIPRNRTQRYWNAKDSAADNYAFMVLTSWFTNRELIEGYSLVLTGGQQRKLRISWKSLPTSPSL